MKLIDMIGIELSEFHREKIEAIDNFDFNAVARKVNAELGGVTNDYLCQGIDNLKRYYAVALLDPRNEHAVSIYVDPFWHAHILHTKEYHKFCDAIYGQYIQHTPLDENNQLEFARVSQLYNYTLGIYQKIFKDVDSQWWPSLEHVNKEIGVSPIVCLHYLVTNSDIYKKALFDRNELLIAA